uniref:Reverse transcriptase domain-containing protein n=1 Tax=Tanacetum cinerariifolium TaxID=118510 RepID=A0A6L2KYE0_TANCI|nr:hypothetical protein [Tanacetum cinerariifolium]
MVRPQQSFIPFLNRSTKEKEEAQQRKFLENLKQLYINIPFFEALVQMTKYAKYLKRLLTNKSRLEEACMVTMNERCSAVLLNKLLVKEKEPGSFTIPCQVSNLKINNTLANLGASISLMPYTMYDKLGRPFFATARAMIDVFNKKITLRLGDDEVLTEREIANKFLDEHSMVLKSKFNDVEPWDIKRILERSLGYNPKGWSKKLNDALWAFKTAYKTPTGCTPFRLIYGKACHLPIEIEHKAHWALKQYNMDLTLASESRLMQLNELAEFKDGAYANTIIYKERTKKWHDSRLRGDKDFKVGDKVLLYNSRLKMYLRKLKSKWRCPNIVKTVYPYGVVEIIDKNKFNFKVNGQRLTKYYEGNINREDDEVIEFKNGVT